MCCNVRCSVNSNDPPLWKTVLKNRGDAGVDSVYCLLGDELGV